MRLILGTPWNVRDIAQLTADKHGKFATSLQISRLKNEQIQESAVTQTLAVFICRQLDYSSHSRVGTRYLFMCTVPPLGLW